MILVTVGTQLPFDRLLRTMDLWAAQNQNTEVIAQTGRQGNFLPQHMRCFPNLDKQKFSSYCEKADIIISHAGIGTILLALELNKPLILLPRRADLREHRNDHQLATVKRFEGKKGIKVVYDEKDVAPAIQTVSVWYDESELSPWASPELLAALKDFINAPCSLKKTQA